MTKKKWILPVCIVCGVVLCLVLVAFWISKDKEKGKLPSEGSGMNIHLDHPEPSAADPVNYEAQYIRTNACHEGTEYPATIIIRSVDELNAYYDANKGKFDLERHDKVYSDTTIGFLDACDKYDEAYFENQILVMVLLEEGSGSNRHEVDSVKVGSDGTLYVGINSIVPEVGTCDMAQWHVLIELEADVDIASESDVVVYLDGINPKTQPTMGKYGE